MGALRRRKKVMKMIKEVTTKDAQRCLISSLQHYRHIYPMSEWKHKRKGTVYTVITCGNVDVKGNVRKKKYKLQVVYYRDKSVFITGYLDFISRFEQVINEKTY